MTAKRFEDEDMDEMHVLYFKSELLTAKKTCSFINLNNKVVRRINVIIITLTLWYGTLNQ